MPMTREEAIKKFSAAITKTKRFQLTIAKILKWDEGKTVRENEKNLGIHGPTASQFKKKYNLQFTRDGRKHHAEEPKNKKVRLLFKEGFTIGQIARLYGVSRQRVFQITKKKQQTASNGSTGNATAESVRKMSAEGKSQNQIAEALGISQPRVWQILNAKKFKTYQANYWKKKHPKKEIEELEVPVR